MKNILMLEIAQLANAQLANLVVAEQGLVLAEKQLYGELETPIYSIEEAESYILSFNALTKLGGVVEVQLRLICGSAQSSWFSYGRWGLKDGANSSIKGQADDFATLVIDELKVRPNVGVTGVQFKAILSRKHVRDASPKLCRIALTSVYPKQPYISQSVPEIDYTVPMRSQMVIPEIGRFICSPTSVCMVLQYYGESIEPLEAANGTIDKGANTYGNWSYSVAYAAEQGYKAFVYYCRNKAELFTILSQGYPIIASVRLAEQAQLRGAPQAYPYGHLIVIRGSTNGENGAKIIVNDSASPDRAGVHRDYLVDDFMNVWNGIIYVIVKQ